MAHLLLEIFIPSGAISDGIWRGGLIINGNKKKFRKQLLTAAVMFIPQYCSCKFQTVVELKKRLCHDSTIFISIFHCLFSITGNLRIS